MIFFKQKEKGGDCTTDEINEEINEKKEIHIRTNDENENCEILKHYFNILKECIFFFNFHNIVKTDYDKESKKYFQIMNLFAKYQSYVVDKKFFSVIKEIIDNIKNCEI